MDLARVLHLDVGVERLLELLTPLVLGHDLGEDHTVAALHADGRLDSPQSQEIVHLGLRRHGRELELGDELNGRGDELLGRGDELLEL